MVFNTQQLTYLVEIERTRSVSRAAVNLHMAQPNLSRILLETEAALGFPIFERTRRGVRPTEKGEQFLQHARSILLETKSIERLGPSKAYPNRFRVCLPRSFRFLELTRQYLSETVQDPGAEMDAVIRECHPHRALDFLGNGEADLAVLRYGMEYLDYFQEQAQKRNLSILPLSREEYRVTFSQDHPLASRTQVPKAELSRFPELVHRDPSYPGAQFRNEIYTVDRLAQLQLLRGIPGSFLWSEKLPPELLEICALTQRPCAEGGAWYQNALVFKPQYTISQLESGFSVWIQERGKDVL